MNELRFGVQVSSSTNTLDELSDLARKVESLGYSSLFFPDHLGGEQWSPLVAMTAASLATTSLRVGALVFSNDYRNPVILAQELATLNEFNRGRLEFGMGAGWLNTDYELAGIPMDPPSVRIARLSESVDIIRELLRGNRSSFQGKFYETKGAQTTISTTGAPRLILGGGGKKMLQLAATKGDIVGVNVNLKAGAVGPELIAEAGSDAFSRRVSWVREASGGRFDTLELQCLTFIAKVSNNADSWLSEMAPAFGVTDDQAKEIPIVLVGSVNSVCETILSRREKFGFSYWVIHQNEIDEFAPVLAKLNGN